MDTHDIIDMAKHHLEHAIQPSSADFCIREALARESEPRPDAARYWALRSLLYSVGCFHQDYQNSVIEGLNHADE